MALSELVQIQVETESEKQKEERLMKVIESIKPSDVLKVAKCRQIHGAYSDGRGGYCALGAISEFFGWDGTTLHSIPDVIRTHIVMLNDDAGWSFERIGAWLAEEGY